MTAELWGAAAREKADTDEWRWRYWQSHPVTGGHIFRAISRDPHEDWLTFTKRRFFRRPVEHGLSLGSGHGLVERKAIELGVARRMDAYDVSAPAIEVATRLARDARLADRITYTAADLNSVMLEREKYGVVFAAQALHHIERLEHLLAEIERSLTPDGLFVVNEYVGPARFQWSDKTNALMSAIFEALPPSARVDPRTGTTRTHVPRPSAADVAREDPTESIRSDEILPLLAERFDEVYRADFGGTLLQFALADVIANFDPEDERDVAVLDLLSLFERTLIEEGVLQSDFVFLVLRRL